MYYTVALIALVSAVIFLLLSILLFFSWNIRKLRRDVKGISLHSKFESESVASSVDSYIQMSEAHGLGNDVDYGVITSGNLVSSEDSEVSESAPSTPVVEISESIPSVSAVEVSESSQGEAHQGIDVDAEESATTLLAETHESDEESATTMLEVVSEETHKILKPVVTYQSWS